VALAVCSSSCAAADAICISSCRNEHQNAVAAYDNLGDCLQSSCADACQSPEAGTSCGVLVFRSAACDACMAQNCCSDGAACSNDADCLALAQCVQVCQVGDTQCISDCETVHPIGLLEYMTLSRCLEASCSGRC
jgi:hypothetical protein